MITKADTFLTMLRDNNEVFIHFDPRGDGVWMPEKYKDRYAQALCYGYDLKPGIADLEAGQQGVYATVSLANTPTRTFIPWNAVFAITLRGGQGVVYIEDLPPELVVKQGEVVEAKPLREVTDDELPIEQTPFPLAFAGGLRLVS